MTQASEAKVPKLDVVLRPSADGASFESDRAASAAQAEIKLPDGARPQDFFIDGTNYQLPQPVLTRVRSSAQHIHAGPGRARPKPRSSRSIST